MTCRSCGGETWVQRTNKSARVDIRRRKCESCGEEWETTERETPGTRRPCRTATGQPPGSARTAISSSPVAAGAQSDGVPVAVSEPNVRASDGVSGSSLPLSDPDPERAQSNGNATVKFWTGWQWRQAFARSWCDRYRRMSYGGGDADAKATGDIADQLAALTEVERLGAQHRAPVMFDEYLSDESPGVVKARHPWSWFVQRFQGLLVPQRAPAKAASPYQEL